MKNKTASDELHSQKRIKQKDNENSFRELWAQTVWCKEQMIKLQFLAFKWEVAKNEFFILTSFGCKIVSYMKNFIINETQTFGKNHSKFQKHYFGINQFLRLEKRENLNTFGNQQNFDATR